LETIALFAQVVYLMFSAVYVFKETVEHVLLSAGEGHHHHSGDEDVELLGSVRLQIVEMSPEMPFQHRFSCTLALAYALFSFPELIAIRQSQQTSQW